MSESDDYTKLDDTESACNNSTTLSKRGVTTQRQTRNRFATTAAPVRGSIFDQTLSACVVPTATTVTAAASTLTAIINVAQYISQWIPSAAALHSIRPSQRMNTLATQNWPVYSSLRNMLFEIGHYMKQVLTRVIKLPGWLPDMSHLTTLASGVAIASGMFVVSHQQDECNIQQMVFHMLHRFDANSKREELLAKPRQLNAWIKDEVSLFHSQPNADETTGSKRKFQDEKNAGTRDAKRRKVGAPAAASQHTRGLPGSQKPIRNGQLPLQAGHEQQIQEPESFSNSERIRMAQIQQDEEEGYADMMEIDEVDTSSTYSSASTISYLSKYSVVPASTSVPRGGYGLNYDDLDLYSTPNSPAVSLPTSLNAKMSPVVSATPFVRYSLNHDGPNLYSASPSPATTSLTTSNGKKSSAVSATSFIPLGGYGLDYDDPELYPTPPSSGTGSPTESNHLTVIGGRPGVMAASNTVAVVGPHTSENSVTGIPLSPIQENLPARNSTTSSTHETFPTKPYGGYRGWQKHVERNTDGSPITTKRDNGDMMKMHFRNHFSKYALGSHRPCDTASCLDSDENDIDHMNIDIAPVVISTIPRPPSIEMISPPMSQSQFIQALFPAVNSQLPPSDRSSSKSSADMKHKLGGLPAHQLMGLMVLPHLGSEPSPGFSLGAQYQLPQTDPANTAQIGASMQMNNPCATKKSRDNSVRSSALRASKRTKRFQGKYTK